MRNPAALWIRGFANGIRLAPGSVMAAESEAAPAFWNILCPIDFSEPSRAALRLAGNLAKNWAVRITVLYVHDPTVAGVEAVAFPDVSHHDLGVEVRNFTAKVLSVGRASVPTTKYVAAIGNPAREILKAATRLHCDLIVMGSRGLGGVRKLFLGSTSDRVVRRARVPVLTVRAQKPVRRRVRKGVPRTLRLAG